MTFIESVLNRLGYARSNYGMAMQLSVSIAFRAISENRRSVLPYYSPIDRRERLVEITKALIQMDRYQIQDAKVLATEKEMYAKALEKYQKQIPVSSWFHGDINKPAYF